MESSKIKLYLLLLVAAIIVVAWIYWPKAAISNERLNKWIVEGYTQQFCNTIYPKIAQCVDFQKSECPSIARQQIVACIEQGDQSLFARNQEKAKEHYDSFAQCFGSNMRTIIVDEYLFDTEDCQNLFS